MRGFMTGKLIWAVPLFFLASLGAAQVRQIPPPKNEAEIKKMMRITWDQHILPEGADPLLLEHLAEAGEVIIYFDRPPVVPWMSAAGILINAPVEQVFSTVTDFEHYPDYVPFTESTVLTRISDNLYRADFHLKVALSFLRYRIDYGCYHYNRPPYRTDWALAWGEFNINVGFWEMIPTRDGKRTMAFYSVYSEPRSALLKRVYARDPSLELMTNVSTATMICRAVKKEAERKFAAAGGVLPLPAKPRPVFDVLAEDPVSMGKFLERGKLIILQDGPTVYATTGVLVPAPRENCWKVIANFTDYPKFMPGNKVVKYIGPGAKGPKYHWEVATDMVFLEYKYAYDPEFEMKPPESIKWDPDPQSEVKTSGFWRLLDQGGQTLAFSGQTADIRAMGAIPRYVLNKEPTLEHAIMVSTALVTVNAIKSEIEKKPKK